MDSPVTVAVKSHKIIGKSVGDSGLQNEKALRHVGRRASSKVVGPRRFELPTSCTPSKRAIQAALRPATSMIVLSQDIISSGSVRFYQMN